MSFRCSDLVVNLSEFCGQATAFCGQATATRVDFCPTASATIGMTEVAPLNLDILRDQLRAALGRR